MPLSDTTFGAIAATSCTVEGMIPVRRVLIIDEHPLVCEGLRRIVEHECDLTVCGDAGTARAARVMTKELDPDVVVVDIGLERGDGIDLVRDLRAHHPQLRILVLSAYDEGIYAERLLSVGANGYVSKVADSERFLSALRRVLDGQVSVSESVGSNMIQKLTTGGGRRTVNPVERLTTRELQIVDMIGRGMSTRDIAQALHLSIKTIESHRQRIRTKLHLESGAHLLRFAVLFHSDSLSRQA